MSSLLNTFPRSKFVNFQTSRENSCISVVLFSEAARLILLNLNLACFLDVVDDV